MNSQGRRSVHRMSRSQSRLRSHRPDPLSSPHGAPGGQGVCPPVALAEVQLLIDDTEARERLDELVDSTFTSR
jgi:hypothetical protein